MYHACSIMLSFYTYRLQVRNKPKNQEEIKIDY